MRGPKNECIDCKAFAALILDYEFSGDSILGAYASGRVVIDGLFRAYISGTDRDDLIRKFRNNDY